jgi:hypothetical protein
MRIVAGFDANWYCSSEENDNMYPVVCNCWILVSNWSWFQQAKNTLVV